MIPLTAEWLTVSGIVAGLAVSLSIIAGGVWWLAKPRVMEWLQDELISPLQETHKQVTVNHHSSESPTVLDRLDDLRTEQIRVREDLNTHLLRSAQIATETSLEQQAMWKAIEAVAKARPPKEGD